MDQEDGRTSPGSGSGDRAQGRNRVDNWGSAALDHDAEFGPAGTQQDAPDDATETDRKKPVSTGRAVREIVETLVLAGLIFLLVRLVVLNFRVDGPSMLPNLQNEQMLLVNVNAYRHFDLNNLIPGRGGQEPDEVWPFGKPERGDIIVFNPSPDAEQPYIKRVIGLPGEHITFQDGSVYINGERLEESYIDAATQCRDGSECDVVVSPEHVFVLGDNRTNSTDSRIIGEVPLGNIIGKAWLSYWPLDLFGFVPHYEYVDQPGGAGASTSQVAAPNASPDQDETPAERRERRNKMREAQGVPTLVPIN